MEGALKEIFPLGTKRNQLQPEATQEDHRGSCKEGEEELDREATLGEGTQGGRSDSRMAEK